MATQNQVGDMSDTVAPAIHGGSARMLEALGLFQCMSTRTLKTPSLTCANCAPRERPPHLADCAAWSESWACS
jgi:hypothetical protein